MGCMYDRTSFSNKNTKVCSFKGSEHIRKKVDGPYFEVSAKKSLIIIFDNLGNGIILPGKCLSQ